MLMPPRDPVPTGGEAPSLRALLNRRMARLTIAACAGYLGFTGLPFLVSLRIDDAFDLASSPRGLILAAYGAAGFLLGNAAGRLVDRIGAHRGAVIGSLVGAAFVLALGFADTPLVLALAWTAGGAASALLWAGLNTIAVETVRHQPRRCRVGLPGVEVRRRRGGSRDLAAAVPRLGAAGVRVRGGGDAGGDPLHAARRRRGRGGARPGLTRESACPYARGHGP